jgi:spore coat protein U-like protein
MKPVFGPSPILAARQQARWCVALLLAAALGLGRAVPAGAVPPVCSVTATGLNFGVYRASNGPVAFTGDIRVQCSGGAATFTVALTAGSSGNIALRQMHAGNGAVLRYQLYLDAARTRPWGDGIIGGIAGPVTGTSVELTVYGLLFAGQHVPAGQVVDTVQAILNY